MERILHFIFVNNTLLIEILFGVVLVGVLYLAVRIFLGKDEGLSGGADLSGIEASLKKIIESSKAGPPSASRSETSTAVAGGGADALLVEDLKVEVGSLKESVNRKEIEIADLKSKLEAAGSGGGSAGGNADVAKLEEQIRDLQGKLDEYSIIEDDIADLSFYKEETVRLQQDLDKVKEELKKFQSGEMGPAAPIAQAATQITVPPPVPPEIPKEVPQAVTPAAPQEAVLSSQDSIDNLLAAHQEAPVVEAVESAPIVPEATAATSPNLDAGAPKEDAGGDFVDADVMAEFQAAVEAQKAGTLDNSLSAKVAAKKAADEAAPLSTDAKEIVEAATPAATPAAEAAAETGLENFDMDKMLNEAQGLVAAEGVAEAPNVLEQSLDTDKLLDEANLMGNEENKLLNEFDNFMKKDS